MLNVRNSELHCITSYSIESHDWLICVFLDASRGRQRVEFLPFSLHFIQFFASSDLCAKIKRVYVYLKGVKLGWEDAAVKIIGRNEQNKRVRLTDRVRLKRTDLDLCVWDLRIYQIIIH